MAGTSQALRNVPARKEAGTLPARPACFAGTGDVTHVEGQIQGIEVLQGVQMYRTGGCNHTKRASQDIYLWSNSMWRGGLVFFCVGVGISMDRREPQAH